MSKNLTKSPVVIIDFEIPLKGRNIVQKMSKSTTASTKQKNSKSNEEFKEDVAQVIEGVKGLASLARFVGAHGTTKLKIKGKEVTVSPSYLALQQSNLVEMIKDLQRSYVGVNKKKKEKKEKKDKLPNLSKISNVYRDFWAEADLGLVNPSDENSQPLVDALPLLARDGVTSQSLLTSLWATYIDQNGLTVEGSRAFIRPDQRMLDYFKQAFDWLERNDRDSEGKLTGFNRNQFRRNDTSKIGSFYTIPRADNKLTATQLSMKQAVGNNEVLSAEMADTLKSDRMRQEVQNEMNVAKMARANWRAFNQA